ncbi:hypothetical protein BC834DRAFT_823290 [Gloeopeniophorella convolvens]|nr:hypothetical protein BC834DRAFT_823290 [Gloeopeniophorella convolvens]
MSYANVTSKNTLPQSQQPQPDPALLTTPSSIGGGAPADDTAKVNVVPSDFKENPTTTTSEFAKRIPSPAFPMDRSKPKTRKRLDEAEAEGQQLWEAVKEAIFRPAVAGGLVGVVNVGLLAGASYAFYTQPQFRRDAKIVTSAIASVFALLGAEGYAAEIYRTTPEGKEAERKARKEGSLVYRHAREHILRPGVLGGLVGLANVGVLGTISYLAYSHWDSPRWDKRAVSAISVGLLALWGGEG